MRFCFVFLSLFLIYSCNSKECKNSTLEKTIKEYIYEISASFFKAPYYSVYFFERDTSKYFGIWVFTSDPYIADSMNSQYFDIDGKNVTLIYNNNFDNSIIDICPNMEVKPFIQDEFMMHYDGSWYPQTYKYFKKNKKYYIEKTDTVFYSFIDEYLGNSMGSYRLFEEIQKE